MTPAPHYSDLIVAREDVVCAQEEKTSEKQRNLPFLLGTMESISLSAESVDADVESGAWGAEETPETNYFKMMMQDNEAGRIDDADDSVVGGATLASMMANDNKNSSTSSTFSKPSAPAAPEAFSFPHHDPSPSETLSIVGIEDDVSTIANDTVNETTKAFFASNGTREASQPRIRLFKEYETPEKSKKKSESTTTEDDETAPETPPGMIRVPGRSSASGTSDDKEQARDSNRIEKPAVHPVRSKRVYIVAGVLAVILFASIIALLVALSSMRDKNQPTTPTETSEVEEGIDILDAWPDLETGLDNQEFPGEGEGEQNGEVGSSTYSPSLSPPEGESTPGPSLATTSGTTDNLTAAAPTGAVATSPASFVDVEASYNELLSLLVDLGAVSEEDVANAGSPQSQALNWLAADPNYYDYLKDRVIQRFALATFAYSIDPSLSRGRRGLVSGWLDYTDECTWFSSGTTPSCDSDGNFVRLDIQNMTLGATLPTQLSLLSNSLRHIILDGNDLQGQIPSEFGQLTLLETLKLQNNTLDSAIPSELGSLSVLVILNLRRNQLSGSIPAEMGNLQSLENLLLDLNKLSGEIPSEIGNLSNLKSVALNDNFLNGQIPDEITNWNSLTELYIGNNELTGDLPRNVCKLRDLAIISVDCAAQGCQCCTQCADDVAETEAPTLLATTSGADDVAETEAPTLSATTSGPTTVTTPQPTTEVPTACVDTISALATCYAPGEDINLVFNNCQPEDDDWVGIFAVGQDYARLPNPPVWSWACGTRNCRVAVSTQQMPLGAEHAASNGWPLEEGNYVLTMARNSAQPYTAFVVSQEFSVQDSC